MLQAELRYKIIAMHGEQVIFRDAFRVRRYSEAVEIPG